MVTISWPATAVVTGDLVTSLQLNGLPVLIANTTLSGDAASIDFTSIPGHYAHLRLVCYLRGTDTSGPLVVYPVLRFNGDTGGNYDYQILKGVAATVVASEAFAATFIRLGEVPSSQASVGANLFGPVSAQIPHYANALNNKDVAGGTGGKFNTSSSGIPVERSCGFWRSNAAITSISVLPDVFSWKAGSRVSLYGWA